MNTPTILCVDDERNVLLTLRTQLSRHFPNYTIEIAESGYEALALVDELIAEGVEIPLVIADQIMPEMQGDELLIELHARHPEILKVMLTGQARAEDVGNVVNRGSLYRFIAKPWNETDLTLTVTEALRRYQQERQLAQQQAALEQANQELTALNADLEQQVDDRTQQLQAALDFNQQVIETAQEGIIVLDRDLRYRLWNRFMENLSGLSASAVLGQFCLDVFPFLQENGIYALLERALAGETVIAPDNRFNVPETGKLGWSAEQFVPLRDAQDNVVGVLGTVHDITDRKQAEIALQKSEASLNEAQRIAHFGNWEFDLATQKVSWSEELFRLYGRDSTQWSPTYSEFQQQVHPDDWEPFEQVIQRAITEGTSYAIEHRVIRPDGSMCYALSKGEATVNPQGQVIKLFGTTQDITESKQAELALQESQQFIQQVADSSPNVIYIYDLAQQRNVYVNREVYTFLGYTKDEVMERIDQSIASLMHPDDVEAAMRHFERLAARPDGAIAEFEYRMQHKNGEWRWFLSRDTIFKRNIDGSVTQILGNAQDITARKQAEIKLQQQEAQLTAIAANIPGGVFRFVYHADGRHSCPFASEGYRTLLGIDPEQLKATPDMNLAMLHPDDRTTYEETAAAAIAGQTNTFQGEVRYILPTGEVKWISTSAQLHRQDNGDVIVDGIDIDVSYRKQIELEISQSRDLREAIFNESADALFLVDPDTLRTLDCNDRAVAMFETDRKEDLINIEGHTLQRYQFTTKELAQIKDELKAQGFWSREIEYVTLQGKAFWGNLAAKQICVAGRSLNLVRVTDISDRKRAEIALRESERRYAALANTAPVGIFRNDLTGRMVYANDYWSQITGLDLTAGLGTGWINCVHPDWRDRLVDEWQSIVQEGSHHYVETCLELADGSLKWVYCQAQPEKDTEGNVTGYVGTLTDITNQKQLELALRSVVEGTAGATDEEFFFALTRNLVEALDVDHAIVSQLVEGRFHPLAFWSTGQFVPNIIYAPEDDSACAAVLELGLYSCPQAVRSVHPGNQYLADLNAESYLGVVLQGNDGQPIGYLCIIDAQPIANVDHYLTVLQLFATRAATELERQRSSHALRQSETELRGLFAAMDDVVLVLDRDGTYIKIPPTNPTKLYLPAKQFIGRNIREFFTPEQVETFFECIQTALATQQTQECEHSLWINGTESWFSAKCSPVTEETVLWVARDISDRKYLEAELRQREAFLNSIYNGVEMAIAVTDIEPDDTFRYIDFNPAYERFSGGVDLSGLRGKTLEELSFFNPTEMAFTRAQFQQCVHTGEMVQFEVVLNVNGQEQWWLTRQAPLKDETGRVYRIIGTSIPITERKRAETQLASQNAILSRIAKGEPLLDILNALIQQVEQHLQGALCSVLLVDADKRLRHGVAPTLPPDYIQAIDGVAIGEGVGSCGTAAFRQETVIVSDIASDRLWAGYEDLALSYGLRACWSIPIVASNGRILGTFAVYYPEVRSPQPQELESIAQMANIAGIAIERDLTEAKIRQSEEQLRLTLEFTNIGAWSWHPLTGDYRWDGKMEELLELPLGLDNMFQIWCDRIHPNDVDRMNASIQHALATRTPFTEEYRYRLLDGRIVWRWVKGQGIYTETGDVERVLGVVQDMTDRKQAEAALYQSEAKNRAMLAAIPDLLLRIKRDGTCLDFIPPISTQEPGFTPIQTHISEVLLPDLLQYQTERIEQALATGELQVWEQQLSRFGNLCVEEIRLVHCEDDEFLVIVRDITDRKRAELALQQLNEELEERVQQRTQDLQAERLRLQLALDAAQMGTWSCNPQTGKLIWSDRAQEIFGFVPGTFPGNREAFLAQLHPEDLDRVTQAIAHTFEARTPCNIEYRIRRLDGEIRWIAVWGIIPSELPTTDLQLIGVISDITDRKRLEQELRQINAELERRVEARTSDLQQAMEAAEAANRAKSTFLANMSHELRTPLNAILGFAQLMSRDLTLGLEKRNQLAIINRSGKHLLNLINDILEMSKIEAGRANFAPNCFDLSTLLDTLAEMFQIRAIEKGLQFIVDLAPTLPHAVETDENKLRQVLINLVGNAIKFTTTGQVVLRIRSRELEGQRGREHLDLQVFERPADLQLQFEVEDTGVGIDPGELESLFEPFIQSSNRHVSQEGTGLGLPISRQFVQLMGGDLTVNSMPGTGSTFAFTIPVQRADAANLSTSSLPRHILSLAPNQPSYRILVVEDNDMNRQLLVQLLQSVGFEVQAAANGQDAIALWQTWQPQLIWMDMRMPIMDGYEATRRIRAQESLLMGHSSFAESQEQLTNDQEPITTAQPQLTKIIALTASAFEENRAQVLHIGCNDFVRKPFQETELLEKMIDYLGVQYLYAEVDEAVSVAPSISDSFDAIAALQAISDSWLNQLYQATLQLDAQQLATLIAQITPNQPLLAALLTEKLDSFDFELILKLVQAAMP